MISHLTSKTARESAKEVAATTWKIVRVMRKKELGYLLRSLLSQERDIVKISRWAFRIYSDNCRALDPSMCEVLECSFSMEDDPQFEYSYEELHMLAKMLINNEEDPIKKINEMKRGQV